VDFVSKNQKQFRSENIRFENTVISTNDRSPPGAWCVWRISSK
jgi:hypothetical protein